MRNPARLIAALCLLAPAAQAQSLTVTEALMLGRDQTLAWGGFTLTPGPADQPAPGAELAPDQDGLGLGTPKSDLMLGHPALHGFGMLVERGTGMPRFGGLAYAPAPGVRLSAKGNFDWDTREMSLQLRLRFDF